AGHDQGDSRWLGDGVDGEARYIVKREEEAVVIRDASRPGEIDRVEELIGIVAGDAEEAIFPGPRDRDWRPAANRADHEIRLALEQLEVSSEGARRPKELPDGRRGGVAVEDGVRRLEVRLGGLGHERRRVDQVGVLGAGTTDGKSLEHGERYRLLCDDVKVDGVEDLRGTRKAFVDVDRI